MTVLAILEYPDARLRTVAVQVTAFDAALAQLVDDLFETLAHSGAIGLAATQVDRHQRVLVTNVEGSGPVAWVNPVIVSRELPARSEESCLSLPGVVGVVPRAGRVRVRAQDRHGVPFERVLTGLECVCVQHELEHLDGVLFADHLPWWRRFLLRRRAAA